ncbi:MAG TPA: hypothetical protein VFI41_05400 [Gemmatimonadales bacterium]|nr:hypothetical protein [Gemmatimonadales bacterium]
MARRTSEAADEKAATCSWKGCDNDATSQVALDAGSEKCESCGTEITRRTVFQLCDEHNDAHAEAGDATRLLLSAKGEDA